jgi:hypothetical protein
MFLEAIVLKDGLFLGLLICSTIAQADATKPETLEAMCSQAKVVLTCAGPYGRYGEPVVKACVETATPYVDITGEFPWVQQMKRKCVLEFRRFPQCVFLFIVAFAWLSWWHSHVNSVVVPVCFSRGSVAIILLVFLLGISKPCARPVDAHFTVMSDQPVDSHFTVMSAQPVDSHFAVMGGMILAAPHVCRRVVGVCAVPRLSSLL